jgi:hypothetical protein
MNMDWKNLLLPSIPPRCAATSACASISAAAKKTHKLKQQQHFSILASLCLKKLTH